ncbi:S1 family peptidase [Streptomyces alboflavus]|uniref:S1 family peptidase n=1 Tax=Streptomyces alboflavus TaxID=67267 RepID=UPI00068E80EF|nr:serine protease [Streptomyces alboflavus]
MRTRPCLLTRSLLSAAALALAAGALSVPTAASADDRPAVGSTGVHERIVGGAPATEEKPWIASLGGANHFCTASLIAPRWVLTAAHCINEGDTPQVRIGSLDRTQGGTTANGVRVVRHPDYDWPSNDIALIELDHEVSTTYAPLAGAEDIAQGETAEIFGWGSENSDWSGPLPVGLKHANGTITQTECTDARPAVLCFGGDGAVAGGDSGGPVMVQSPATGQWVQAGVCAVGTKPTGSWSGYTNIALYRDWIKATADV